MPKNAAGFGMGICFLSMGALVMALTGCSKGGSSSSALSSSGSGSSSSSSSSLPSSVEPKAISFSGGGLYVDKHGSLWTWGSDMYGLVGDGEDKTGHSDVASGTFNVDTLPSPKNLTVKDGGKDVVFTTVAGGNAILYALDSNGSLWSWGYDDHGMLGDGDSKEGHVSLTFSTLTFDCVTAPKKIEVKDGGLDVVFKALSDYGGAIDSNGSIWAWGDDTYGAIGDGSDTTGHSSLAVGNVTDDIVTSPKKLVIEESGTPVVFKTISSDSSSTTAISTSGALYTWGDDSYGAIGDGDDTTGHVSLTRGSNSYDCLIAPKRAALSDGGKEVSFLRSTAFNGTVVAIDGNGSFWTCGNSSFGQAWDERSRDYSKKGNTSYAISFSKESVADGSKSVSFVSDSTSSSLSLAIDSAGSVWAAGEDGYGALGDGDDTTGHSSVDFGPFSYDCVLAPKKLTVKDGGNDVAFASVSVKNSSSLGLDTKGNVWTWGSDQFNGIGDGADASGHSVFVSGTTNYDIVASPKKISFGA